MRQQIHKWLVLAVAALLWCGCTIGPQEQDPYANEMPAEATSTVEATMPEATSSREVADQAALQLEKRHATQVLAGKPFDYVIELTNRSDSFFGNVVVTDRLPEHLEILSSEPEVASRDGEIVRWHIDEIGPAGEWEIRVQARMVRAGRFSTNATVSYEPRVRTTIQVLEPALTVAKWMPSEAIVSQAMTAKYIVTNSGTAPANNVWIEEALADNVFVSGDSERRIVKLEVGELAPGETRELSLQLEARGPGSFGGVARATADLGIVAESPSSHTIVRQPVLELLGEMPRQVFIGRTFDVTVTIVNSGDAAAVDLVAQAALPVTLGFLKGSDSATYADGNVTWSVPRIEPGTSHVVTATCQALEAADVNAVVRARAEYAQLTSTTLKSKVVGLPDMQLDVRDLMDPIMVGEEQVYEIVVTNSGTAPTSNVKLVCTLEKSMKLVGMDGASNSELRGSEIHCFPLATMGPGEEARWRVTTRAVSTGDVRFKVRMTSSDFERPVEESVATRVYQ